MDERSTFSISGFWRRLVAFAIDGLLLGVFGFLLGLVFFDPLAHMGGYGRLLGFAIALAYFGILNSNVGRGQTVGKRALGIRVVDREGQFLSVPMSCLRYAVLGIPFFLNGAPFDLDVLTSAWGYLLTMLIFGGIGSIAYLYIFNRRTRQSLHDLVVGSFVVQTHPQEPRTPPGTFWRGHLIVVAVLLAASGLLPLVGTKLAEAPFFKQLIPVQAVLSKQPNVQAAVINVGTSISAGNHTDYVAIQLRLDEPVVDDAAFARRIARLALDRYPPGRSKSFISVLLLYGYDIGIASGSKSHAYQFTPAELTPG